MKTPRDTGIGKQFVQETDVLSELTRNRTIHGMVYNAMKLFMEVNPQLFDDCSHDYAESQNNAGERERSRQNRWEKLKSLQKPERTEV